LLTPGYEQRGRNGRRVRFEKSSWRARTGEQTFADRTFCRRTWGPPDRSWVLIVEDESDLCRLLNQDGRRESKGKRKKQSANAGRGMRSRPRPRRLPAYFREPGEANLRLPRKVEHLTPLASLSRKKRDQKARLGLIGHHHVAGHVKSLLANEPHGAKSPDHDMHPTCQPSISLNKQRIINEKRTGAGCRMHIVGGGLSGLTAVEVPPEGLPDQILI